MQLKSEESVGKAIEECRRLNSDIWISGSSIVLSAILVERLWSLMNCGFNENIDFVELICRTTP